GQVLGPDLDLVAGPGLEPRLVLDLLLVHRLPAALAVGQRDGGEDEPLLDEPLVADAGPLVGGRRAGERHQQGGHRQPESRAHRSSSWGHGTGACYHRPARRPSTQTATAGGQARRPPPDPASSIPVRPTGPGAGGPAAGTPGV